MITSLPKKRSVKNINTDKFFLSVCASKFLCLRKQNWCDLGTQGHVHDDFGQIIYQSANARLLDRGIYEYSKEPLHAKKKYHNFPYDREFPEIYYVRKFERQIPGNKHLELFKSKIILREFG